MYKSLEGAIRQVMAGNKQQADQQPQHIEEQVINAPVIDIVEGEDEMPASPDEKGMAMAQLKFIKYAADEIGEYIEQGVGFPEWFQNKLTKLHELSKDLHAYMEGENSDVEDDDEEGEDAPMDESLVIDEATKHPAYDELIKQASVGGFDKAFFQKVAGKLANFRSTGNRGNIADLATMVTSADGKDANKAMSIIGKADRAMWNAITHKIGGRNVKEEVELEEKTLTPAEKKKREEIAKAIEKDQPNMPMDKKMAIATAQAKKVAEEVELDEAAFTHGDVIAVMGPTKTRDQAVKAVSDKFKISKDQAAAVVDKIISDLMNEEVELDENRLLKVSKISSAEYQKAKKLKGFDASKYKWNPDTQLYHKVQKEEVELEENSYTGTAPKPIRWVVSPVSSKVSNPKKYVNTEVKAKTKLAAMKLGAKEMGMKLLDVKAVPKYPGDAKLVEEVELDEKLERDGPKKPDDVIFRIPKGKVAQDYMKKKVAVRDAMNKKNDPGADKQGRALSVLDKEKAYAKFMKKFGYRAGGFATVVGKKGFNEQAENPSNDRFARLLEKAIRGNK